jgi:hypothetical protein
MISGVGEAPGNEIVRKRGCFAGQILALDWQSAPRRRSRLDFAGNFANLLL